MTTDTLIEEAMGEMHRLGIDNLRAKGAIVLLVESLRRAIAERDELRATVTRLNRRAQTAEAGVRDNMEASKAAGKSMGRTLANAAADMYRRRAEKAEAERDAQRAEVLRLTGELQRVRKESLERARTVLMLDEDLDEARAQVWGLICAGSNMAERKQHFRGLWETALEAGLKLERSVSELTATRDLLTEENARLRKERDALQEAYGRKSLNDRQAVQYIISLKDGKILQLQERVATLELLLRGGK